MIMISNIIVADQGRKIAHQEAYTSESTVDFQRHVYIYIYIMCIYSCIYIYIYIYIIERERERERERMDSQWRFPTDSHFSVVLSKGLYFPSGCSLEIFNFAAFRTHDPKNALIS